MRIAYSCAGEGFGHAARMVVVARRLEANHETHFFVPENVLPFLQEKLPGFRAESLPHFSFVKRGDRIRLLRTSAQCLPQLIRFPAEVGRLCERLRALRIEAVIADFEPYLAWAARMAGIPIFQVNHPGIIAKHACLDPRSWLPALAAGLIEGPWDERVIVSFFDGDVGPLFRPTLFAHEVSTGDYIVFNLKDSYRQAVVKVLERFPHLDARIFPAPGRNFEQALAGCRAVVSSAGHQIIAEALALGKPILVLPQRGQWEQRVNAVMLERLGGGMVSSIRNLARDLPLFLARLERFRSPHPLPAGFRLSDGTAELQARLDAFLARVRSAGRPLWNPHRNDPLIDKPAHI